MDYPYITPNRNTSSGTVKSSQSSGRPQDVIGNLLANLRYLQNQLEGIRRDNQLLEEEINPNGDKKTFLGEAREALETQYENKIADIEGTLARYVGGTGGVSIFTNNAYNPTEGLSGYDDIPGNGSVDNFPGGEKSIIDSIYDFGSNAFNSFASGISEGFKSLKNLAGKAADWFVSQIKGRSNPNEDSSVDNGNCAFASSVMLGRIFGKLDADPTQADSQIEYMRSLVGETDEYEGATLATAAKGLQQIGLNTEVGKADISDLAKGLQEGKKFMLAVNGERYEEFTGKDLKYSPHAVVLMAIQGDSALLYDPAEQKPLVVSLSALKSAMNDMGNEVMTVTDPNAKPSSNSAFA